MRITNIELKNFEGFYGEHSIDLDKDGKNLILYGENGSGKSSLFEALKTFFESSKDEVPLNKKENIFVPPDQKGDTYIKIVTKDSATDTNSVIYKIDSNYAKLQGANVNSINNANKIKGFLNYKSLLKTHFIDLHEDKVNLFHLLVEDVLSSTINPESRNSFGHEWEKIKDLTNNYRQGERIKNEIRSTIEIFNQGLDFFLKKEIQAEINLFLSYFDPNIEIEIIFQGLEYHGKRDLRAQELNIKASFHGEEFKQHQYFFNEARLSALAISIYLATIKSYPSHNVYKILFLDDLLIGLDMSNRLPLLKILQEYFVNQYQIIMSTYDKSWYYFLKDKLDNNVWKFVEMYPGKTGSYDFEVPVIKDSKCLLTKAQEYFQNCDYKASAVYARSEFERLLKTFCENKSIPVRYCKAEKDLKIEDFLNSLKLFTNISEVFIEEIENNKKIIMNPLSHYDIHSPEFRSDLENTLGILEKFKNEWNDFQATKPKNLLKEIDKKDRTITNMKRKIDEID